MRICILLAILTAMVVGCAARIPVVPDTGNRPLQAARNVSVSDDPHRLWGEYLWYINKNHDHIDVVPQRQARFHLNALKFLESYCTDCVKITNIKNNGDGTIDVTVRIKHPFSNSPQYTGFDVKGIVMFDGSDDVIWSSYSIYPFYDHFHISWKESGDAELLNPDGYSVLWNPTWNSESSLPMFNYWPGKYSHGTPTANLNAFLNFYTDEKRHMFRVNGQVERTYHIWLPKGPLVVGYAVDACWEPPTTTPVTDPLNDFPYSANQPEPYFAQLIINGGQPITTSDCCIGCSTVQFEFRQWYGPKPKTANFQPGCGYGSSPSFSDCADPDPTDDLYFMTAGMGVTICGNGKHRGVVVAVHEHYSYPPGEYVFDFISYFPFDYTVKM